MFRSVFRLTLIFTLALIVSGSILTYFSINYISNLKELTGKKILDEEDKISILVHQRISEKLDEITSIPDASSDSMTSQLNDNDSLKNYPCVTLRFIMKHNGEFIRPWYVTTFSNFTRSEYTDAFNRRFFRSGK